MTVGSRGLFRLAGCFGAGALILVAVLLPTIRRPAHADAVILLSGDGARLTGALQLMARQVAPTLVFVGTPDVEAEVRLCTDAQAFEVVCMRPIPDNTRTEAQVTGQLATVRQWRSIVLVTSRFHLTRARIRFSRCFGGIVDAVGEYPTYGRRFAAAQVIHEILGLAQVTLLARAC